MLLCGVGYFLRLSYNRRGMMLGKTPDVQREPSAALALTPCLAGHAFSSTRGSDASLQGFWL